MRGKRRISTVGELRRVLAEQGDPWTVDPRLEDDDLLPDLPTGGQREADILEEHRLRAIDPDVDLSRMLADEPPNNHWLALTWAEVDMVERSVVEGIGPIEATEFGPS